MSSTLKSAGNSVVLSRSELDRLRKSAVIITPQLKKQRADKIAAERNAKAAKSNLRKQTMVEKERAARERAPLTEAQIIADCKRIAYLEPLTENELSHDSAKTMDTL